jgi:nucleoside 2-deoxyribosyltransferase
MLITKHLPKCAIIMPFQKKFDEVRKTVITAVEEAGIEAVHNFADPQLDSPILTIRGCDLIIADISEANPNIMYEIGYANALKKDVFLMVLYEKGVKIPFELSGSYIYVYTMSDLDRLEQSIFDWVKEKATQEEYTEV